MIRRPLTMLTVLALLVACSTPAFAQTSSDYFLHGVGSDNNPPTLLLNTTAPTASTEKFRDSAAVTFSGSNPWKEIGTWPAAAPLTTGTLTALALRQRRSGSQRKDAEDQKRTSHHRSVAVYNTEP